MSSKRILIVDDEEAVLAIMRSSLKKLGPDYEVATACDGLAALDRLREQPFDLVVTDYMMGGMDGLALIEAVHAIQPQARVIMVTAYGTDAVQAEARRLQAFRYLTKPLEIDSFRRVVQEAVGEVAISRPGILILSDARYRELMHALEQLSADVGARGLFLANANGQIIARVGSVDQRRAEEIASLLGGGFATLAEVGRALDGDEEAVNLAYHEGREECLYALNIGQQLLLILLIERGRYSSRIGSVWYYAQQAAALLRQTLGEAENATPPPAFDEHTAEALGSELDDLWNPAPGYPARLRSAP
jgi:CheY-like chemotaxis protein